jgi:chromosome segregation ATPase
MQGDSQFPIDHQGALGQTQQSLIQSLRAKTQEVEELSMKIDELYQINSSLENLMSKVQRFNADLFQKTLAEMNSEHGQMTPMALRTLIGEKNKELETFPRQNKNCIEYYEKYKLKYEELDSKFT